MANAAQALPQARDSVCAIMRVIKHIKYQGRKKPPLTEFRVAFVGTAWCIVANKYLVTAHHLLNNGKARDPNDLFYAFTVPNNGPVAYHFRVTGFPVEEAAVDLAVLEVGPPATSGQQIPAVAVTFTHPPDAAPVLTYGFPSPVIANASFAPDGTYLGGNFFLKGHANEGIVAAQYEIDRAWQFEFNVGWHHGESGGPVQQLDPLAVFAVMQHYRNIQTPHGVHPGPHCGRSLDTIQGHLRQLGATIV